MTDETQTEPEPDIDWSNDYLRGLSQRMQAIEDEREALTERVAELKAEAHGVGVFWPAFMVAHKIRQKLTVEDQLAWHSTFAATAEQLSLFVEEG